MKPPQLYLIVILLHFTLVQAQENQKLDSLLKLYEQLPDDTLKVNVLGKLYFEMRYSDMASSVVYAQKQLGLAKNLNYDNGIANGYSNIGNYYLNIGQGDSAKFYHNKALEMFTLLKNSKGQFNSRYSLAVQEHNEGNYKEAIILSESNLQNRISVGDSLGIAGTHLSLARSYEKKGSFKIAYDHLISALKIYDLIEQPLWKADALFALTALESTFKNYRKAISYAEEALVIYKDNDQKVFQMVALNGIGQLYMDLEDYRTSLKYLLESLTISMELSLPRLEGVIRRNLGRVYIKLGQPNEGIVFLKEAVELHRNTDSPIELFSSLTFMGEAYNEIKEPEEGLPYFNEAIELLESKRPTANGAIVYEGRSKTWELINKYNYALRDYKEFKTLNDSIFDTNKTNQIEELRTIYDTEKKEQQIALQEKEITVLEQKQEISKLQKMLMGIGLVTALIVFYALRQKMKRNKLERDKVEAELAYKKKELTTHALHLAKKNEVLETVKQKVKELKRIETGMGYQQLIQTINFDQQDDKNWENFTQYFEQVHKDFAYNVKARYPDVSKNELRFMALLKMNMSSKEIATILNISPDGIKKARQRLRKKMDLSPEDSLESTVLDI
ncbi:tetratricopeptide repeat protein [Eudoraea chungangensis]|uniref:tetratricopeptide repeat protein n=1 Tax=Eudoraea chungangensis TaxID=1481905 RepID=UPI0023EE1F1B|nr:tetratricopeptide repeat protein [Eudoraea chungangensis]